MVSPQFCLQASHRMASCQMPLLFHTFLQPSLPAPSAYATHPRDGSCPDLYLDRPFRRPELSSRQKALIHRLLVSDSPSRRNTPSTKDEGTTKRTRVQFGPAPLLSPRKGIGRGSREPFCPRPHTDKVTPRRRPQARNHKHRVPAPRHPSHPPHPPAPQPARRPARQTSHPPPPPPISPRTTQTATHEGGTRTYPLSRIHDRIGAREPVPRSGRVFGRVLEAAGRLGC